MKKKVFVGYIPEVLNIENLICWDNVKNAILIWWNGNIHKERTSENYKKIRITVEEVK